MPQLLTAPKVAELLGVSAETVRTWAKDGQIRFITLPSGVIRFRREDIDAILEPEASA
jgi:excisionase family DNA binding protein